MEAGPNTTIGLVFGWVRAADSVGHATLSPFEAACPEIAVLTIIIVVALITCALMFVGLPGLLDPLPAQPIFDPGSGFFG